MFLVRFVYAKPIKLIFIKLGDWVLHRPRKNPLYFATDFDFTSVARYGIWPWGKSALNNAIRSQYYGKNISSVEI